MLDGSIAKVKPVPNPVCGSKSDSDEAAIDRSALRPYPFTSCSRQPGQGPSFWVHVPAANVQNPAVFRIPKITYIPAGSLGQRGFFRLAKDIAVDLAMVLLRRFLRCVKRRPHRFLD